VIGENTKLGISLSILPVERDLEYTRRSEESMKWKKEVQLY